MLDAGLVVGIQDLGAAGITGAASETSSKGGVGMDLHLSEVHVREQGMEPFEIMISESQERMLAIVEPASLDEVLAICERWEISASVIGTVTGTGRFRVLDRIDGEVLGDIPASSLDADAPLYDRPLQEPADRQARLADRGALAGAAGRRRAPTCSSLLADPSWVFSQYDHQLFLNTVEGPGGDATVLRLKHPTTGVDTGRGLALTMRRQPPLVRARPPPGHGARRGRGRDEPGLRGGPPARARELPQLRQPRAPRGDVAAVRRRSTAWPRRAAPSASRSSAATSASTTRAAVATSTPARSSAWSGSSTASTSGRPACASSTAARSSCSGPRRARCPARGGPGSAATGPARRPRLDLDAHVAVADLVRDLVAEGRVAGVHDAADGLGVALAEMAVRSGRGFRVVATGADHAWLFAESASRVVVCAINGQAEDVVRAAQSAGVTATTLGTAGGDRLVVEGLLDVSVADAVAAWKGHLPAAMEAGATH